LSFPDHLAAGMKITVVRGDITRQDVEAVVTAANTKLRGGGGVGGAVHAAAGPRLLQASLALAPCPPGGAVLTEAFDLAPVRWVIHAVGPIYQGPQDAATLTSAYMQSLARADEVGAQSGGALRCRRCCRRRLAPSRSP
jgi:O-acetyl-ADP-ribose deacetylase (regulator of RNase III)